MGRTKNESVRILCDGGSILIGILITFMDFQCKSKLQTSCYTLY